MKKGQEQLDEEFHRHEGCCWGRGYRDKLSFSAGRAQSRVYLQDQLRAEKENELVDLNGTSHEMGPQRKDTIP